MSQGGNCTPSAKRQEAFLKCNLKKSGGLRISRMVRKEKMSHGETVASQDLWRVFDWN